MFRPVLIFNLTILLKVTPGREQLPGLITDFKNTAKILHHAISPSGTNFLLQDAANGHALQLVPARTNFLLNRIK